MYYFRAFGHPLLHALKNLFPIVVVVVFFQFVVLQQTPDNTLSMAIGLLIVAVGVALFLQGLELSIFPMGKSLSNQFAKRGSVPILLSFGFAMGFSAVVAEPALIAVAQQAQSISEGKIDALTLRLLVATSVGLVIALGVFRTIFGYPLHWFMIIGYITVVVVTWFSPEEIVGLAYDSGGVTTSEVTVPLVTALGIGLASNIEGRSVLLMVFEKGLSLHVLKAIQCLLMPAENDSQGLVFTLPLEHLGGIDVSQFQKFEQHLKDNLWGAPGMKLVKEVMVSDVICVSPFAKLREALSLMKKHSVKSLVVEKQHPNDAYGLITYTNVLKTVVAEKGDIDLLNVYDACAKPALAVGKSLGTRQVAALMTEHRVKRILVLEDNDLLGFVTMDDIMAVLLEHVDQASRYTGN